MAAQADIEVSDIFGMTLLMMAIYFQNAEIVSQLLQRSKSYRHADNDGRTILHYAAAWPNVHVLRVMKSHELGGVNSQARTKNGHTAVQIFQKCQHRVNENDWKETEEIFYALISEISFNRPPQQPVAYYGESREDTKPPRLLAFRAILLNYCTVSEQ